MVDNLLFAAIGLCFAIFVMNMPKRKNRPAWAAWTPRWGWPGGRERWSVRVPLRYSGHHGLGCDRSDPAEYVHRGRNPARRIHLSDGVLQDISDGRRSACPRVLRLLRLERVGARNPTSGRKTQRRCSGMSGTSGDRSS